MALSKERIQQLEEMALKVREHCISMATDGGCFLGASLSCVDIVVELYRNVLHFNPSAPDDPDRDRFFLSKGHDVPALYGTFAELGMISPARLTNHLSLEDHIYWHPNRAIPGVEYYSGSLGHLLSVAMGTALDLRMSRKDSRVFVLLGDGELNEGSVWEGVLVAAAHRLGNLVAIVDRNSFQANMRTEDLVPLEPLAPKFEAFGWSCQRCDGHSFAALDDAFSNLVVGGDRPQVIIADTQRGRGLPSIAERADRWFCNFTAEEIAQLLEELHGRGRTDIKSETLIVR